MINARSFSKGREARVLLKSTPRQDLTPARFRLIMTEVTFVPVRRVPCRRWLPALVAGFAFAACSSDEPLPGEPQPAMGTAPMGAGTGAATSGGASGAAAAPSGTAGARAGVAGASAGRGGVAGRSSTGSAAAGGGAVSSAGMGAAAAGSMSAPAAGAAGTAEAGSGAAGTAAPTEPAGPVTWVPHSSWDCGMPDGIPPPESGEPAFEVTLPLAQIIDVGMTPLGKRQVAHSNEAAISGARLDGTFLEGGLNYDLELSNGVRETEDVHILRTGSGTPLYLRVCGVARGPGAGRVVAHFEAPSGGSESWLNEATLVGTRELDPAAKTLKLAFYEIKSPPMGERVMIEEPADVMVQGSWECKTGPTRQGEVQIQEDVLIGGSVAVGAVPAGSRNIIPITGGTFMGDSGMGDIIPGGGDFQLSAGGAFILDARYTLKASDGSYIIVRNCGPTDALIPVLETAIDSPNAWVNGAPFVSTVTVGVGRVYITLYKAS